VSIDDPAMREPPVAHTRSDERSLAADRVATVLLIVGHAFLVVATLGLLGLLVMGTDACGDRQCGGQVWIDRAMAVGLGAGAAVFVVTLVVAVRRLARHRVAFFVPMVGCATQVALAIGAAAMESLAGPV
jgi:hypothetical protein